MLTVSSADLNAWIALFMYPLARILGVLAVAPPFSNRALPVRTRLLLGLAVSLAAAPALPPLPSGLIPGSGTGLALLGEQILIGFAMGFFVRLAFAAISVAGEIIGLQMGLGFATFYDPQNTAQTPIVSEYIGLVATLIFLSINGHLMVLATVVESFHHLPVGGGIPAAASWRQIADSGAIMFTTGLLLALPVIVALLITNVAMGVLSRAAPQLNLFAVGFPLTLAGGFIMLILSLGYIAGPLTQLFERMIGLMLGGLAPR